MTDPNADSLKQGSAIEGGGVAENGGACLGHGSDGETCMEAGHGAHHGMNDARRLVLALIVIFVFMIIEIIGAIWSGSLALLADAGHMATDTIALGLALLAGVIAKYPANKRFPYGFERAQILAAFVNGLGLFLLIVFLAIEAVERLFTSQEINTGIMFYTALIGLGANIVAFVILHRGSHDNLNMRGAILHVIGDMLGSVAAVISALIISRTGFLAIDPLLTLLVCVLIGRSAWGLCRESVVILLQGTTTHYDVAEISQRLKTAIPEIATVRQCRLWMLTPGCPHLSICVAIGASDDAVSVRERAKRFLKEQLNIDEVTLEVDH